MFEYLNLEIFWTILINTLSLLLICWLRNKKKYGPFVKLLAGIWPRGKDSMELLRPLGERLKYEYTPQIFEMVKKVVVDVERSGHENGNTQKNKKAFQVAKNILRDRGQNLTDSCLNILIESAVQHLKQINGK